jgi:hypothetical protein
MAALYQKQNKRNGGVFFVAAVYDRRKRRSWSVATGQNFETMPIAAKKSHALERLWRGTRLNSRE